MTYYQDDKVTIYNGDCIAVMAAMPENSVDAIVTDPPYGLEFMGKEWDKLWDYRANTDKAHIKGTGDIRNAPTYKGGPEAQLFHQQWATEALRVLKPGGHALVAGIGRTHHRTMCGMEDAGFEIRDCVYHLFGSGFPKSTDISKQIDKMAGAEREVVGYGKRNMRDNKSYGGNTVSTFTINTMEALKQTTPSTEAAKEWEGYGTGLKPACEIWVLARKPISEKNIALNCLKWGVGALSIDECRIGTSDNLDGGGYNTKGTSKKNLADATSYALKVMDKEFLQPKGRFPANIILDEEAAAMLDEQSGDCKTGIIKPRIVTKPTHKGSSFPSGARTTSNYFGGDTGGASRYFKVVDTSDLSMYNIEEQGGQPCGTIIELQKVAGMLNGVSQTIEGYFQGEEQHGSGNNITVRCQRNTKLIILTLTKQMIELRILLSCLELNTENYMVNLEKTINGLMDLSIGDVNDVENISQFKDLAKEVQVLIMDIARNVSEITCKDGELETESIGMNTIVDIEKPTRFKYIAKPSKAERGAGNTHATVKPIKLMEYLIRLITREGQTVLDPFGGSMTTVLAAVGIGRKCIAIEKDEGYCEILKGRCRQIAMI